MSKVKGILFSLGAPIFAVALFVVVRALFPQTIVAINSLFQNLKVEPSPAYSCKAHPGDIVKASFTVYNESNNPVRLLGAQSSCFCTVAHGLPQKLQPHGSATLGVWVTVGKPDESGKFTKSLKLITDNGETVPPLVVQATVIDANATER